jgi:ankyrin repeat protein
MSPNVRSRTGDSALMMAIGSCSTPPVREHHSIALVLIEAKADVNFRNNIRVTPLIQAADKCEPEVIQALINAGAEVNARAAGGGTALLLAEVMGKTENAKILRKAGGTR